jgi:hypothetical protein
MLLANIAWRLKRDLKVIPLTGQLIGDREAQRLWIRTYEKSWEPKV